MKTNIICTVDTVLLTLLDGVLQVALLKRDHDPYKGALALPGGYIHAQEDKDAHDAADRVLRAKTGIVSPYLEQLKTFAGPTRDPRGWSASIAHFALVNSDVITAGANPGVELLPVSKAKGLPFDHEKIVAEAVKRLRNKSSYSTLPLYLMGEEFTIPQLKAVYEAVLDLDKPMDKVSFRRKMLAMGYIEPVGDEQQKGVPNRPGQLYSVTKAHHKVKLKLFDRVISSG